MSIPDYQTLMLPVLKTAGDSKEHRIGDVVERLADDFESVAKRFECDEDKAAFEAKLRKIVKAKVTKPGHREG